MAFWFLHQHLVTLITVSQSCQKGSSLAHRAKGCPADIGEFLSEHSLCPLRLADPQLGAVALPGEPFSEKHVDETEGALNTLALCERNSVAETIVSSDVE